MAIDIFTSPLFANGEYLETITGIPYLMLHQEYTGVEEEWTPELVNGAYACIVAWDDANQWLVDMLGKHLAINGTLSRTNPAQHVFNPSLYCVGCKLMRAAGQLAMDPDVIGALSYDYALYKASFSSLPYDLGSDDNAAREGEISRYVERDRQDLGEAIQYNGGFVFPSGSPPYTPPVAGTPIPTPPAIMISYAKLFYTHYYVPGDPNGTSPGGIPSNYITRANSFYGFVNSVPFDSFYTVGTVLYLGLTEEKRIPVTPYGNTVWRMKHSFAFRPQGWNVAYYPSANSTSNPGPNDWMPVVNRATGLPPYGSTDLDKVFQL